MLKLLRLLVAASCIVAASVPAHSDLVLSLQDPNATVIAGLATTLHFLGTITNTDPTTMTGLKGAGFMIPNDRTTKIGLPDTILPTYLWSTPLAPGESYVGEVFSFSVAPDAKPGYYEAYCRIGYHPNYEPAVYSNNADWSVTVLVPEPSSILALICGTGGLNGLFTRRRSASSLRKSPAVSGST